jgi:hypothetical protein
MSTTTAVLPQGAGYGVVVGIGFFFALVMAGVSWMQVGITGGNLIAIGSPSTAEQVYALFDQNE